MKIDPDSLAARMKEYEFAYRLYLPRRSYTVIRIDGRAFHTFTKGCNHPYDSKLGYAMRETAWDLVREIDNAILGYVQSDEISILVWDDKDINTSAWFKNNLQKICSVSASIATARFNRYYTHPKGIPATFDSRVWILPTQAEVFNYFYWRWQDASLNSVSMLGQHYFSHNELHGKKKEEVIQMVWDRAQVDWHKQPPAFINGMFVWTVAQPDVEGYIASDATNSYMSKSWNLREDKKTLLDLIPLPTILKMEE